MITYRLIILLVCFLVCSITPISALEMGSVEYNNSTSYFTKNNVEEGDNLTSSELGGLYYTNNIHRPNDPPDKKIIYIAVGITLLIIAIIIGVYCFKQYLIALHAAPAANVVPEIIIEEHVAQVNQLIALHGFPSQTDYSCTPIGNYFDYLDPKVGAKVLEHMDPDVASKIIPAIFDINMAEIAKYMQPDKLAVMFNKVESIRIAMICVNMDPVVAAKTFSFMDPDKVENVLHMCLNEKQLREILRTLLQ